MKKLILAVILSLTLFSTACSAEGLQVNERAFVQLFGLERAEDVENNNIYHVSMQLLDGETVSGSGITIAGAVADAELEQGKKLFLGQMKLFVIGNGLSGMAQGFSLADELNLFLSGTICPACPVIYAEEPSEIAESGEKAEDILAKLTVASSQGKSVITPLTEIAARSTEPFSAAVVPMAAALDGGVYFYGLTFIGMDGQSGVIPDTDALGVKILTDSFRKSDRVTVSLTVGRGGVSAEILSAKTKLSVRRQDGILYVKARVKISADITEKPETMPESIALEAVQSYAESEIYDAYANTAWGYGVNTFGIDKLIRKQLPNFYPEYLTDQVNIITNSALEIEVAM